MVGANVGKARIREAVCGTRDSAPRIPTKDDAAFDGSMREEAGGRRVRRLQCASSNCITKFRSNGCWGGVAADANSASL
eukprot:4805581-Prymnesium_polylepis.2